MKKISSRVSAASPRSAASSSLFLHAAEQFQATFDHPDPMKASRCTIVSALDELVLTQETPAPDGTFFVPQNVHLTVQADTVVIRGPLSLPSRDVVIAARVLGVRSDKAGRGAQIDVSGAAGIAPAAALPKQPKANDGGRGQAGSGARPGDTGTSGQAGADGKGGTAGANAGTVTFFVETIVSGSSLTLVGHGGAGGAGQVGQTGQDAGHGGAGGNGARPVGRSSGYPGTRGGHGGVGGAGGSGGGGGAGGRAGTFLFAVKNPATNVQVAAKARGGAGGAAANGGGGARGGNAGPNGDRSAGQGNGNGGNGGKGGASGQGGAGGTGGTVTITNTAAIALASELNGGASGPAATAQRGGDPGSGPNAKAGASGDQRPAGTAGGAGTSPSRSAATYGELAVRLGVAQPAMVLAKVKLLYLVLDPADSAAGDRILTLLRWLYATTAGFAATPPPAGFTPQEAAVLAGIYREAASLGFQLALKRDGFGQLPSFVPQGSFNFYSQLLDSMLGANGTFTLIEKAYADYFAALAKKTATMAQLGAVKTQAEAQRAALVLESADALDAAKQLVPVIDHAQSAVDQAYEVMKLAVAKIESQLATIAGAKCIFKNIIDGLNLISSLTGSADAKQAAALAKKGDGAFSDLITKVAGLDSLPTDKIIKQLDVLGADVVTIDEGFTTSQGVITPADPAAYKLLATEEQLEKILQPYLNLPAAAAAVEAMRNYVTTVQLRNREILRFNAAVAQYATAQSRLQQCDAQLALVTTLMASASDPALAPLVAFVARLYHDARRQVIYALYMASRSFAFWSLKADFSAFRAFVGLTNPAGITSATLTAAMQSLRSSLAQAIEDFGTGPQNFPAPGQTGLLVTLTAAQRPALFAAFKKLNSRQVHQLTLRLPPALRDTPQKDSPFFGLANIRLSKVRAWIYGAKTDDGTLDVAMRHGGAETIVDPKGAKQAFTHEPITKRFRFDTKRPGEATAVKLDGDFDVKGKTAQYAQPGPFTEWTLTVSPANNTGLVIDGVDRIVLEFFGNGYAFPSAKQVRPAATARNVSPSVPARGKKAAAAKTSGRAKPVKKVKATKPAKRSKR